jgi:dephospho-CoA kinase
MHVIGTVGLPGSGKGEAATVARDLSIPVVTMGDVVREATRERGLDPEEDHGRVATELREEEGKAAIAERSLPAISERLDREGVETVLVDGLRSPVEVEAFEAAFGEDFLLVSIEAPFEARAERLRGRARERTDEDEAELRKREERELGFGMGEVMDMADVTIENTDDLETFHDRIRRLFRDPEGIATNAEGDR